MTTIGRIVCGCMGVVLLLGTGIFMLVFWPVGIVMGIFAFGYLADAFSKPQPQIIYRRREPSAILEFGPNGPPVAEGTPPIQLRGRMIFPSAIQSIKFFPPSPPNLEAWPQGITTPILGTAQGHHAEMRLEGGEVLPLYETDDNSLRYWVLHHVETARPMAAGISLVDSK